MSNTVLIPLAEFAKILGISVQMAHNYRKKGAILEGSGMIRDGRSYKVNLPVACQQLHQSGMNFKASVAIAIQQHRGGAPEQPARKAAPEQEAGSDKEIVSSLDNQVIPARRVSEQKKAHYEAEKKKLELLELTGDLVRKKDIDDRIYAMGKVIKEKIMAIPDRISARVAAEADEFTVNQIITDALAEALEALSQTTEVEVAQAG